MKAPAQLNSIALSHSICWAEMAKLAAAAATACERILAVSLCSYTDSMMGGGREIVVAV